MNLYPLKFHPILKERIWGGRKLITDFGKPAISNAPIGESWEISGVPGDVSVVANGALQGTRLDELIDRQPEALLGKKVYEKTGKAFPVLIKFIDAQADLSIQVHPNDALAKERHHSPGKTEMWFILQADKNARLNMGFNKPVDKETYLQHLNSHTLPSLLHYESVNPGDAYFIEAGQVHAIGAGILLAEIQQTSDITYRIYDYDRTDSEGKKRELHTELALDAINFKASKDFKKPYSQTANTPNHVASCPYFITNYWSVNRETDIYKSPRESFTILIITKGTGAIETETGSVRFNPFESFLVPAASKRLAIVSTQCEFLEIHL